MVGAQFTGPDGRYRFTDLLPDVYVLRVAGPRRYFATTPHPHQVNLSEGAEIQVDFGWRQGLNLYLPLAIKL